MYSYKYELLRLLDEREVREKIFKLIDKRLENFSSESVPPQKSLSENLYRSEEISTPVDNDTLKNSSDDADRQAENYRRQLDDAQLKISQLENSLSQSQRQAENYRQQLDDAQSKISRLENSLSESRQSSNSLQRKFSDWQQTFNREQSRAQNLQRELDDAQEKISQLEEQLKNSFARGQELFQKYRQVGAHARQILGTSVFVRDDFTSFICGGAQSDSLEKIWDVLKTCVMDGNQRDAEILGEIFDYCLELVNASKSGKGFSILPVNVGDRFDSNIHSEVSAGLAQGKISVVCLPGFRNDYSGRLVRKSIVQVG